MEHPLFVGLSTMDDALLQFLDDERVVTRKYSKLALSMFTAYLDLVKEGKENHATLAISLIDRFNFAPNDALVVGNIIYKDFGPILAMCRRSDGKIEYGRNDSADIRMLLSLLTAKYQHFSFSYCFTNPNAIIDYFWRSDEVVKKYHLPTQVYPLRPIRVTPQFEMFNGLGKQNRVLLRIIRMLNRFDSRLRAVCVLFHFY
jgi:hypothetical protein